MLLLGVLLAGGLLLLPIRADDTHCCSCCGTKDARRGRQIKRLAWRRLKTCSRADRPLRRWHALRREIELVRAFRKVHRARVREAREDRETSDSRCARTTRTSKFRSMAPPLVAPGSATGSAAFVFSGGDRAAERDAVCRVVCAAAARPGPLPSCRGGCVALVAPPPSHAVWRSIVIKCWRRLPWQFFWSSGVLC